MAFPLKGLPKLSGITSTLSTPEAQFEKMVREAAEIELPEGPLTMLTKMGRRLESGNNPMPELPGAPKIEQILARLPELPKLPELPIGKTGEEPEMGYQAAKEEKVTKRGYVPIG